MDRTEYLKLCQQVSMFTATHRQIPSEMLVKCATIVYCPYGIQRVYDNGKGVESAILHDLRANAITYADLERVEKYEQDNKIADSTV